MDTRKAIDLLLDWSAQLADNPTLLPPVLDNPSFSADDRAALELVQQRVDAAAEQVAVQLENLERPQPMRQRSTRQQTTSRISFDV